MFIRKSTYFILMIFILIFFFSMSIHHSNADELGYKADPILSKKLQKIGYYKYKVHPNQTIRLPFIVYNNSNRNITVNSSVNNAYSANNGYIAYDKKKAPGLLIPKNNLLSSMVIGKKEIEVKLKPHSSRKLSFTIKTPNKLVNGNLIGGINSISNDYINDRNVVNNIQYSTTILLNHNDIKSDIHKINLSKIYSGSNFLRLVMHNAQNAVINNYQISVKVKKKNRIFADKKSSNYGLVPNSLGIYNLDLFDIKPGYYDVLIKITDKHNHSSYITKRVLINNSYQMLNIYNGNSHHDLLEIVIVTMFLLSLCVFIFGIFLLYRH